MINWTIKIARPTLTDGMFFQVRYRKIDSQEWTPLTPNPTANEFVIPVLEDNTNYEAEIRTICVNGELSRAVYVQLKDGQTIENPTNPTPTPTQPETLPFDNFNIYWGDSGANKYQDRQGYGGMVVVVAYIDYQGTEYPIDFEIKKPNSSQWENTNGNVDNLAHIDITEIGMYQIRAVLTFPDKTYYSNILKYTKIDDQAQPPTTPKGTAKRYLVQNNRGDLEFSYIDEYGNRQNYRETNTTQYGGLETYVCAMEGSIYGYDLDIVDTGEICEKI